mgnify:CR=1 FL=1
MLHLISIMDALESRDMDEVNSEANLLLQLADDILELATAYMDFVHPIYLDIQRHGTFDEEKITQLKSKLMDTLVKNKNKIKKEFDMLTKPRITEEWMKPSGTKPFLILWNITFLIINLIII